MPSEDLTHFISCVSIAEKSLKEAERTIRRQVDGGRVGRNETEDSDNMEYQMRNKYMVVMTPFVDLSELLNTLYGLKLSLKLTYERVPQHFQALVALYKGAMKLENTKMRFPPAGVYVDLERGECGALYQDIMKEHDNLLNMKTQFSTEDAREKYVTDILNGSVNPLIRHLEQYESHLENRDRKYGIYNRDVFEEVHSARWVVKTEDVPGHYEMKNVLALSCRPFVDCSDVLRILQNLPQLYPCLGGSGKSRIELKQLISNPLYLLKDPNVRFPADGVYVDITEGKFIDIVIGAIKSGVLTVEQSTFLFDYESFWDDAKNGIFDRVRFEKHFSALWIPD